MEKLLKTDDEILNYYGWEVECGTPYEIRNNDGSFASGQAILYVIDGLRKEYIEEQYEKIEDEYIKLRAKKEFLENSLTDYDKL